MVREDTRGSLHIIPRDNTWQNGVLKGSPPPPADGKKLPRPPNAFILYRQHHHPIVKEAHPELHNNQICKKPHPRFTSHANCVAAIILGKQWRKEDLAVKEIFKRKADGLKKKHFLDHPDYQYQPRKSAEKKRRMTRRKAETLSESSDAGASATDMSTLAHGGAGVAPTQDSAPVTLPVGNTPEPEFERTVAGNPILNFGDEWLEDGTFEAMLLKFNESVDKAPIQQIHPNIPLLDPKAVVLHSERTQGTQQDFSFYESELDEMVRGLTNENVNTELDRLFESNDGYDAAWEAMSPEEQNRQYDLTYAPDFDAALHRYTDWEKEL